MEIYIVATLIGTVFLLCAYEVGKGNTALNMVSALGLLVLIVWLVPELRYLPIPAYVGVWVMAVVGLQVVLPLADGKPYLWVWQMQSLTVAVRVRPCLY